MAGLVRIRRAMKTVLTDNIPGLMVYNNIPDAVQAPCVVIEPQALRSAELICEFGLAFDRGMDLWRFKLYIMVPRQAPDVAQEALDSYLCGFGPRSIREVFWENNDLGLGDGTDVSPKGIVLYGGKFETAAIPHVGAVMLLEVLTSGKE